MASVTDIITNLRENFRVLSAGIQDDDSIMGAFDRATANTLLRMIYGNGQETPKPKRTYTRKPKTTPAGE